MTSRSAGPRCGVTVAFLESGLTTREESPELVSLERRIYRLYGQLKVLETELERARPGPAPDQLITALEDAAMRLAGALPIA